MIIHPKAGPAPDLAYPDSPRVIISEDHPATLPSGQRRKEAATLHNRLMRSEYSNALIVPINWSFSGKTVSVPCTPPPSSLSQATISSSNGPSHCQDRTPSPTRSQDALTVPRKSPSPQPHRRKSIPKRAPEPDTHRTCYSSYTISDADWEDFVRVLTRKPKAKHAEAAAAAAAQSPSEKKPSDITLAKPKDKIRKRQRGSLGSTSGTNYKKVKAGATLTSRKAQSTAAVMSCYKNVDLSVSDEEAFRDYPDWCPQLCIFDNKENWHVDWTSNSGPLALEGLEYFDLLHPGEAHVASTMRLSPEQFLRSKRALILAAKQFHNDKVPFRKSDAQKLCRIDVNKTSTLWHYFGKLGWLGPDWQDTEWYLYIIVSSLHRYFYAPRRIHSIPNMSL